MKLYFAPGACSLSPHIVMREAGAQYDLEQTTVLAPTAGFVTQVSLRPGMYVSPAPLRPVKLMALRVCERRERKKRIGRNRPSTTLAD